MRTGWLPDRELVEPRPRATAAPRRRPLVARSRQPARRCASPPRRSGTTTGTSSSPTPATTRWPSWPRTARRCYVGSAAGEPGLVDGDAGTARFARAATGCACCRRGAVPGRLRRPRRGHRQPCAPRCTPGHRRRHHRRRHRPRGRRPTVPADLRRRSRRLLALGRRPGGDVPGRRSRWPGSTSCWSFDPVEPSLAAGGTTNEGLRDGPPGRVWLAQPSGLAAADDRCGSSIRDVLVAVPGDGIVATAVGAGLFDFGLVDGPAEQAHAFSTRSA